MTASCRTAPAPTSPDRPLPALVVVSRPPGAGKTTLAHALARAVGCPAVCRDEIKEGMAYAGPGFVPGPGDELLVRAGVTTVAEAAFQDRVWRPRLVPLLPLARLRVVHCTADAETAFDRVTARRADSTVRRAHPNPGPADRADFLRQLRGFSWLSLDVPSLEVDTTSGYRPDLAEIAAFAGRG